MKVGGAWGWLGVGFIPNIFIIFFLVLHSNTLQQRNWKSCLKVGHSSAVSIETSSQRAVRFTSTGGAFPAGMGYSRLSPLTRVLRSTLQGGTHRGHTQPHPGTAKDNALVASEESRGSATSPVPGDNATSCGVPPYSHRQWHNVQLEFRVCTQQTRLQLHFGLGGGCIHLPPARLNAGGSLCCRGRAE